MTSEPEKPVEIEKKVTTDGAKAAESEKLTADCKTVEGKEEKKDGAKRPREDNEEGHADKKRRKQGFFIGDRGIFYTTSNPRHPKTASQSILNALTKDAVPSTTSITASLAAEAEELRGQKAITEVGGQLTPKSTGFLKFHDDRIPSDAVTEMLEKVEKKELFLRFVCRVLPIDVTCKPHFEDFVKVAEQKIKPIFDELRATNGTWALEFKTRNSSTIKKEEVLKTLDQWSTNVKANLGDPTLCILVEVNPMFCGISILRHWGRFKKYNANSMMGGEKENAQQDKGKNAKTGKTKETPKEAEKSADTPMEEKSADTPMVEKPAEDSTKKPVEEKKGEDKATTAPSAEPVKEENKVAVTASNLEQVNEDTKATEVPVTTEPVNKETEVPASTEPLKATETKATEVPAATEPVKATETKEATDVPAATEPVKATETIITEVKA